MEAGPIHPASVRIGVAGWDYPDWRGVVYPARDSGLDRLAFLARFVDLIEINSTFYRAAAPRTAASWLRRTRDRPRFRFAAKAHRSWTHERHDELRAVIAPTLEGLAPLKDGRRLSALLVQFPQSFHRTRDNLDHLERILDACEGWPLAVEVRHASWDGDEAADWLAARGAAWCVVDQPRVGRSTAPPRPRVTSRLAYLRLHGRNTLDWFRPDAGRDARYDYLYCTEELLPLADAARGMTETAEELIVVQNNHFRGQALVNALQMKHLIEGVRPRAPAELARVYPQLESFAEVERDRLF